jgi:hypothetical protein
MTARFDPQDFTTALRQFQQADPTRAANPAPNGLLSAEEWQQSEELKVKLIAARVKLKLMRDRTDALKEALERFRTQRDAMRA